CLAMEGAGRTAWLGRNGGNSSAHHHRLPAPGSDGRAGSLAVGVGEFLHHVPHRAEAAKAHAERDPDAELHQLGLGKVAAQLGEGGVVDTQMVGGEMVGVAQGGLFRLAEVRRLQGLVEGAHQVFIHPRVHRVPVADRQAAAALVVEGDTKAHQFLEALPEGPVLGDAGTQGNDAPGHGGAVGEHPHRPLLQGRGALGAKQLAQPGLPLAGLKLGDSGHGQPPVGVDPADLTDKQNIYDCFYTIDQILAGNGALSRVASNKFMARRVPGRGTGNPGKTRPRAAKPTRRRFTNQHSGSTAGRPRRPVPRLPRGGGAPPAAITTRNTRSIANRPLSTPGAIDWLNDTDWVYAPVQDRSRKTLRQILTTAKTLFVAKGFDETAVTEISRQSKISVGSIYHRFPDKQSILYAILETYRRTRFAEIDDLTREELWQGKGAADVLDFHIEIIFSATRKDRGFFRLIERQRIVDKVVRDMQIEWNQRFCDIIAGLLRPHAGDLGHADIDRAVRY